MGAAGAMAPIVPCWTPPTSAPAGCPCSFTHEAPGNSHYLCSRANASRQAKTAAPAESLGTGGFKKKQEPGREKPCSGDARQGQYGGPLQGQGCPAAGTGMPSSRQEYRDHREKRAQEQQQEKV